MKDKWLRRDAGKEAAITVAFLSDNGDPLDAPRFEISIGKAVDRLDAGKGFVSNGRGRSPYDNLVIDPDYIKAEAQAGRMKPILYAVAIRNSRGERAFRSVTAADLDAIGRAEIEFATVKAEWMAAGYLPTESIPQPLPKHDIRPYGFTRWLDMFTPRQALVHGNFARAFSELIPEVRAELGHDLGNAVLFELALMQGKALNYNSRLTSWHAARQVMRSVFDRHDFSFKWTFAEFDGAGGICQGE